MWIKKQPEESIVLSFSLERRVRDKRIKQAVNPYPNRWTHHVVIERSGDFGREVRKWLLQAYQFASKGGK